jgi:hypothetical protein
MIWREENTMKNRNLKFLIHYKACNQKGIVFRPENENSGAWIDIPANGTKLHETLHYPKGGDI